MTQTNLRNHGVLGDALRRIVTLVVAVAFTAGLIQNAAADFDYYHGSICHPHYGTQSSDFRHLSSGIKNYSIYTRWVSCPIDREVKWESRSNSHMYISARVYNHGGTLYCEGYSVNTSTGAITDSQSSNTSTTGNTTLSMRLDLPTWGQQYYVRCLLPPHSKVKGFHVYQQRWG